MRFLSRRFVSLGTLRVFRCLERDFVLGIFSLVATAGTSGQSNV